MLLKQFLQQSGVPVRDICVLIFVLFLTPQKILHKCLQKSAENSLQIVQTKCANSATQLLTFCDTILQFLAVSCQNAIWFLKNSFISHCFSLNLSILCFSAKFSTFCRHDINPEYWKPHRIMESTGCDLCLMTDGLRFICD